MFKRTAISVLAILLALFSAPDASAKNGAEVSRGVIEDYFGWSYNEDEGLFYGFSSFSNICGWPDDLGEILELPWMTVHRPNDSDEVEWDGKYMDHGLSFVRVLMVTPEEFWNDPCVAWENWDLIVADGMIFSTYNDNDQYPADTNRANIWGFTANGALKDTMDICKGPMVGVKWIWRARMKDDFPACEPDCDFRLLKAVGPELHCN
jgi:hypothetical protein